MFEVNTNNVATLMYAHDRVDKFVSSALEKDVFSSANFDFKDSTVSFNPESHSHQFNHFKQTGVFIASINLGHNAFHGFSNVHMYNFKVCVRGANSTNNKLKVLIRHPGTSHNIDYNGKIWSFNQLPKVKMLLMDMDCNIISEQGSVGDLQNMASQYKAHNSPFSMWIIDIPQILNPKVNLKNVTSIEFHMTGTYQALQEYNTQIPWIFGGNGFIHYVNSTNPIEHDTTYFLGWEIGIGLTVIMGLVIFCISVSIMIGITIKCMKKKYNKKHDKEGFVDEKRTSIQMSDKEGYGSLE